MPKQSDGMEKLVEEILERIQFVADIGMQSFQATSAVEWAQEKERRGRALAKELITLTLKAVMDGMSLPREEGRGRLHAHGIYEDVDWDDGRHGKVRNEEHRFIALRREGIGKEEE